KTFQEIQIGDFAESSKTVSESDIYLYAGITGDFNPAHVNEAYAKGTRFGTRIAHGMLMAGFVSSLLGTELPGAGSIYMGQEVKFLAPVHIGDTITARVEVVELIDGKRVKLRTSCTNQFGVMVLDGAALVMPPRQA
ncbi:MAG: MaoC family dehydratase, partial [Firmicutes bacterium]|nr:MaoC family dehydratase [Bacillota bacterium]